MPKRLKVHPSAKFLATIMGGLGVIAGLIYSVGGLFYDILTTGSVNWGTALAFGAIIGMPLLFSGFGYVTGAIGAFLYNLLAGLFGR